ncbi:hypothetical protein F4819DRAFT_295184 [Hypoxylon fuscum]|nr:hypothetical protein F4819DRAFT_295184 [Hypoxylon fuscum]
MPRPKRSRVASTRAVAKAKSPVLVAPPAPQEQEQERQRAETSSDIYDVSDREKDKAKHRRESLRDMDSTSRTLPVPPQQAKALKTARQRRDSAMDRLENMTSTSSNQVIDSIEPSDDSIELGRKVAGTPQRRRMGDMTGLDLDDDMFDDLNTTFDTAGPASAQQSADTSTISASLFKRRPRAGSFLNREEGYIRPSSRAGPTTPGVSSTFNIGMFRRRQREPSILGTAQKPRPQRLEPEPQSEQEDDDDDDDEVDDEAANEEGGFAPEAESTPLRRSKRRSGDAEVDRTPPQASTAANPRKRKSSEGHHGRRDRSSPFADSEPDDAEVIPETQATSELSAPPSTPPARVHSSTLATPVMDEEFMAPPLSSSPSGDDEIWPPLQALAHARTRRPVSALRRTPVPHDGLSDMSSPPSLTYSPNYRDPTPPPQKKPKRKADAKKVTTADLAGLLPRRRRRNAVANEDEDEDEDAEVDISGLGDGDDELAFLDVRARRHPARPASRAGTSKNANTNQNTRRGRPASRGKGKEKQKQKETEAANRRATITYGRHSDKENQGSDEDEDEDRSDAEHDDGQGPAHDGDGDGVEDSQALVARVGEELKQAARKFQEVDQWQLDYEEMTQSSSPPHAR